MMLFLMLCLNWAAAYESAPILSEAETLQAYRQVMDRHAALEKYWLSLSGTLKTVEKTSSDPKPAETKIFLKVQGDCYHKIALFENEDLAHWVPHLELWLRNDSYFAELYQLKVNPGDPHEIIKWRLRAVNRPSSQDNFQNYYLCRMHRETVFSVGTNFWRCSYLLSASAKNLHSIKRLDSKSGSWYVLKFDGSTAGLAIKDDKRDWTKTRVGSAEQGYLVYDVRLGAITAMNIHWVSSEGYHYLISESANYRRQDSLLAPLHRQCDRQLLSAEGKAPRIPQIDQFICDYDLSVVTHPADIFTISPMGFDEPEGLQQYNKFGAMIAESSESTDRPSSDEPTTAKFLNWKTILIGVGAAILLCAISLGYYLSPKNKKRTITNNHLTWTAE